MEEYTTMDYMNTAREPKYTVKWIGLQCLYILVSAFILALVAMGIESFADSRVVDGLLKKDTYSLISQSTVYCFVLITISGMSLSLIEIAFRKSINLLQYLLIALALTLFYLLLLSMAEFMPFALSYIIVSLMTIGLITWFVKGITKTAKAVRLTAIILAVEYALIFILIELGTLALLVGSLTLFVLIALAMYFTLKLKVVDGELTIK